MGDTLSEDELIKYAKSYLKSKGFKKKNKRWMKESSDFIISFLIHGTSFDKDDFYVRPGIFIKALMPTNAYYGDFMCEIKADTAENVLLSFEEWCRKWTNKSYIKESLESFIEWEKRNPLEKRRKKVLDYLTDPIPAKEFLRLSLRARQYILENF